MQIVSDIYRALLAGGHDVETRVVIGGTLTVPEANLVSVKTSRQLFSGRGPSIGGAISGQLDLTLWGIPSSSVPRMAEIKVSVRLRSGSTASEWIPKGAYYTDTRDYDAEAGTLTIHAYDAMLRSEGVAGAQAYLNHTAFDEWPQTDIDVVGEIAKIMGIDLDSRTEELMTSAYSIDYPNDYSMREILRHVAAAYAGNFVISDAGELLLTPLNSIPPETSLLTDNAGNALTFGGDAIILD